MVVRPARPRVLHLLSDWKCAGPAAPIVDLVRHLRRAGFPVDLACARPPAGQPATLPDHARARHVEPVLDSWSKWWSSAREKLRRSSAIGMTEGRSPSLFLRRKPLTHGERLLRRRGSLD